MKKWIAVMIIVILLGVIFFQICGPRIVMKYRLNTMQTETKARPSYVVHNTFYGEQNVIDFDKLVSKNVENAVFKEIVVIKSERIWFVYRKDDDRKTPGEVWCLASVNENGSDLQNHFYGEFGLSENAGINVWVGDPACRETYYEEKNAFYAGGKIVLQDGVKLIEYDMKTGTVAEKEVSQFVFPEEPIIVKIENWRTIHFLQSGNEKHFTVDEGRQSSSAFRKMMTLEEKKTAMGAGRLANLFHNVQFVGNEIYIICRVLNWHGETYMLVYQYDFESNSCQYVGNHFMDDVIGGYMYFVETVGE